MPAAFMMLRRWQAECIAQAHRQYRTEQPHFLCLATPGAGKTTMAASLAKQLFDQGMIDLILCFAPSVIVADDFRAELEHHMGCRMDGVIGSRGCAMTYQAMLSLSDGFWTLFSHHRVFVIFDEIHHCAGSNEESANAWGEKILCEIQGRATYTLALTGTPWRSDRIPIVLSRYGAESRHIHCDYQYGLYQSIQDRVCRTPKFIVIDNDQITVNEGRTARQFDSIRAVLAESSCAYQQLLEHDALIDYIVRQANAKLDALRNTVPNAGGLIVAASVAHAHQIARVLKKTLNENASIATYYEDDAAHTIRHFKEATHKWIIAVGMISEGTNIPRLRVCCYLTRVKTELYFRQVLGRIVRSSGDLYEAGYLYMPAEPTLTQYAERIASDIPEMDTIRFEQMPKRPRLIETLSAPGIPACDNALTVTIDADAYPRLEPVTPLREPAASSALAQSYDSTINLFGKFKQEILSLRFRPTLT